MVSQPQVESIARLESTVSTVDSEVETETKPLHISIRLIGDKGIGKTLMIDKYLGKETGESTTNYSESEPRSGSPRGLQTQSRSTKDNTDADTVYDESKCLHRK